MKKVLHKSLQLLSTALFVTAFLPNIPSDATAQPSVLKGDANADSAVDVFDLCAYRSKQLYSPIPGYMDLNFTGTLTKTDIKYLSGNVLGSFSLIDKKALVINEVCASNTNILKDTYGKYSDWIEIYNGTSASVNLSNWGLSDSKNDLFKWTFPSGTAIGAGQYLTVFASGSESKGSEIHTSFSVSKDGETIRLTSPDGTAVDVLKVPPLDDDITFGRFPNGSDVVKAMSPTYGKSNNNGGVVNNSSAVKFELSAESGFYNSAFSLSADLGSDVKLFYTDDSTVPTLSSKQYASPINIKDRSDEPNVFAAIPGEKISPEYKYTPPNKIAKGTVIRGMAFDQEDGNYSVPFTKTYFIGINKTQRYPNVPVISLVSEPDNFFGYENGIYMMGKVYDDWAKTQGNISATNTWSRPGNYTQGGKEWERPVHFDFFETDGSFAYSAELGIRIAGAASRANFQKSFRLYARGEYGVKNVKYPLLPGLTTKSAGKPLEKFDTFLLRTGANDADFGKIRDPFVQESVKDRSFDTQGGRPCVVFLDGEYWGVYNLQQDYNDKYVENHYGVPADEVIIIQPSGVDDGVESDMTLWKNLIYYARDNNLSVQSNYSKISEMMDIDNFIEYFCANIYINNADWPDGNWRTWRSRSVDSSNAFMDGRWRWMMYDTEFSMGLYDSNDTKYNVDTISVALNGKYWPSNDSSILFRALMNNEGFKQKFSAVMADMMSKEFTVANSQALIDRLIGDYGPLMTEHMYRQGPFWALQDRSGNWVPTSDVYGIWRGMVDPLKTWLSNRYSYVPSMMRNHGMN